MERYHVKIGFKQEHIKKLEDFTSRINSLSWKYSAHSIDGLNYRAVDVEGLLRYIKGVQLEFKSIFEYYVEGNDIVKVCYRINYNQIGIILVLNEDKLIITIYLNSINDNHETLRKELYTNGKL